MVGRVDGKAIIVTGAGSGMGRAFSRALAREGAAVGVLDRDETAARAVADAINADSIGAEGVVADPGTGRSHPVGIPSVGGRRGRAIALVADVSSREQVVPAFDRFAEWAGGLDVLFNNAGFNKPMHLLDVTESNWHAIMNVNGLGVLIGIQEGARRMIPRGGGKIINTSSIAGRQGYPSFAPYCASKFAVNALTQAAARGLAQYDITCNAFAPGVVDTPLWTTLDADLMAIGDSQQPGQAMSDFAAGILRGRPATSEDIVGTALYLASSDSDYLTGQTIMIDGGMVLV
jgi:meso-butanediol dehydrogenase/(S,S)-butanediol dehydrogenase/diacetyl reductase